MTYLPREIVPRLKRALEQLPVVVLSGLRQAGKSTLLQEEVAPALDYEYRTMDDFPTLTAARSNPEALLGSPVILDEVQRCPEILITVKRFVDERREPGRYILSGSANLSLLGHVSETLAGRAGYFTLFPMTRREQRGFKEEPELVKFMKSGQIPSAKADPITEGEILRGGLPPACLSPKDDVSEWFRGYVQTYVERDVRMLTQITDLVAFRTLAQLASLRTAQTLSISSLARDAKLSVATAARWLDLLDASFVIRKLPPFLKNRTSRLVKSPKLFFTDSGLAAFMAGVRSIQPDGDSLLRGSLYETYVAQNLSALLEAYLPDAELSFWNEQGRQEVDFVIEYERKLIAIEVKAATRWTDHDLKGLRSFATRTPNCQAAVLAYNGLQSVKLDGNLFALPLGVLLS